MIPYGRQSISDDDIESVVQVLRSDLITQGPTVPLFEEVVAGYCGAKYGVATTNATSALHVACLALGLRRGDLVWTSPNTFAASANCALYCGANIDFVDIDPVTYNLSVASLRRKLEDAEKTGKLPKIVIPVHFAGQSCEMKEIATLSKYYGFRVLEDASHAIGGRYRGQPVGNCRYSDITVFSFHPVKIITTGEGGMALTNDPALQGLMSLYRSHGISNEKEKMSVRPESEIWKYQQIGLGFNYRMTDIQAALGLSQMKNLDKFVFSRRSIAANYDEALPHDALLLPAQNPSGSSSYHLYPIRVDSGSHSPGQIKVTERLINSGLGVNHHYIPVYRHPYYESLGFKPGYCPEAEMYFRETISLPIYPKLTESEQDFVIQSVLAALN